MMSLSGTRPWLEPSGRTTMTRKKPFFEWVATGLGAGFLPIAPGTWGSLEGVAIAWGVHWGTPHREGLALAAGALLMSALGVWAASKTAAASNDPDPSRVVIDEVSGQLLTYVWVPLTLASLVFGFLLFRVFDIVKPFPARQSERLPGGWGIMIDDLIAGLFAGACLWLAHTWLGWI